MPGSKVDPEANSVSTSLKSSSIYILMGYPGPAPKLDKVAVYPNPYKPNLCPEHNFGIRFGHPTEPSKKLPAEAIIKVYNAAGELIWTRQVTANDGGVVEWNVKNNDGEDVRSGIYIYYISDLNNPNDTYVGKIGIVK